MGYFSSAVSVTASYLPAQVTETFNQARAFTTVTVPRASSSPSSSSPDDVALASASASSSALPSPPLRSPLLASSSFPHQVALASVGRGRVRVLLATNDGYLYIYDLPGERAVNKPYFRNIYFILFISSCQAPKAASAC